MTHSNLVLILYILGALSVLYLTLLGVAWIIGEAKEQIHIQSLIVHYLDIVRDALLLVAISVILLMTLDHATFTFAIHNGSSLLIALGGIAFFWYLLRACYSLIMYLHVRIFHHKELYFSEEAKTMKEYTKVLRVTNAVISAINWFMILSHVIVDKIDNIHHP
jgi:hypothetical protein